MAPRAAGVRSAITVIFRLPRKVGVFGRAKYLLQLPDTYPHDTCAKLMENWEIWFVFNVGNSSMCIFFSPGFIRNNL